MYGATLLLQSPSTGSLNFLMLGLMLVVFWFFLIRPQAKKQREQKNFEDQLEKGQEVVTASGIIGRVNKIEDSIVTLEIGSKVYIRITKNAISKEMTHGIFGKDKKVAE
ncbi:MAG: preprotein translocase subunit YajC [Lewinellaceae bacterium]|nr:preprotein translocase subunit YajC [Lewinellaceae bacterium]